MRRTNPTAIYSPPRPSRDFWVADQPGRHPSPPGHPQLNIDTSKHGLNVMTALRAALTGSPWRPAIPTPT